MPFSIKGIIEIKGDSSSTKIKVAEDVFFCSNLPNIYDSSEPMNPVADFSSYA